MINIKTIEELSIGMVETYEKIITESDVDAFANLSGNHKLFIWMKILQKRQFLKNV